MTEAATLSELTPVPEHVPETLVYDFDMFKDPAYRADPHKRVLELIENAPPVFWTPRNGGHWMLVSHSANFEAARDCEGFSSEILPYEEMEALLEQMADESGRIPRAYPINLDPPLHGTYRKPLQGVFSPRTINDLKEQIRTLAGELLDGVAAAGECEFMSAIAEPLPVKVFLGMLGMPVEKYPEYRALVRAHMDAQASSGASDAIGRLQKVAAAMRDTIVERRDKREDDIISMLWGVQVDGRETTQEDLENYGVLLFIAGLDTVMQGIGLGARHLAENPDLQQQLRDDPSLISNATEELLRRYTFTVPPRRVAKDMEFQGVQMKKDERAMLFLPGADLDPTEYANPQEFNLKREGAHIAFNAGPHRCLGSHLARIELNILYEELLARLPQFRLDPARPPSFNCGHVVGVESLHLLWGD
ncbi:MAG: cytochrome P450 [Halioglobus sp.]|nr:cytochrome P450 [Halioglobus sp.]